MYLWHAYFDVARIDARPGETRAWALIRFQVCPELPKMWSRDSDRDTCWSFCRLAGYFLLPIWLKATAALKTLMPEIEVGPGLSRMERTFAALCACLFFQAIFMAHCEWLSPLSRTALPRYSQSHTYLNKIPPHTHRDTICTRANANKIHFSMGIDLFIFCLLASTTSQAHKQIIVGLLVCA